MRHIMAMIHCSSKSKSAPKALRPLNHHVCVLFKEASGTDRERMNAYDSASIKVLPHVTLSQREQTES